MNNRYKYVNLSYLKELSGGDLNFQKELIGIFLKQMPEFVSNIQKYLSGNDKEKLAKEAHTAKSSVLIFMMEETGKTLRQIQKLADSNQTNKIPPLLEEVKNTLQGASKELSDYISSF